MLLPVKEKMAQPHISNSQKFDLIAKRINWYFFPYWPSVEG
jgi:hypothetical protein